MAEPYSNYCERDFLGNPCSFSSFFFIGNHIFLKKKDKRFQLPVTKGYLVLEHSWPFKKVRFCCMAARLWVSCFMSTCELPSEGRDVAEKSHTICTWWTKISFLCINGKLLLQVIKVKCSCGIYHYYYMLMKGLSSRVTTSILK